MFIVQDLHMVELEDFKYGGTNITAFRLVDPNDELVQVMMMVMLMLMLMMLMMLMMMMLMMVMLMTVMIRMMILMLMMQGVVMEWIQGETWHKRINPFSGKSIRVRPA